MNLFKPLPPYVVGLNDTNSGNAQEQSIDDAIIDYLSRKGVTDQTEKLALARISSKMEISTQQVEASISRLSAKNLIRKVYVQRNVGFELTPKGKTAIEVIAKAKTARIARQLQEAIHQQRKAKLRSNNIQKTKLIEEEWQNYEMPDRKMIDEIEQEATKFLATTKEVAGKQPFCNKDPQNYDQEFSKYKLEIEKLTEQNNNLTRSVTNYAKIKNCLLSISADIGSINKTISKYEPIAEATDQVTELKTSLGRLKSIQSRLENFEENQLSRFEELRGQIGESFRVLESLKKPTHEFTPVKRESIAEKTTQYPDPECPIIYSHKTSRYPIVEKCSKCGAKRKSTPVDIG